MLRIVRDLSRDPVFILFKVLGRRHRLLYLDALTILYLVIKRGTRHGALCAITEAQREYRQAQDFVQVM